MKRIIVTGCGGPAGVNFVRSLRIAPEKIFIVGTDSNKYHLQLPDLDRHFLVPKCTEPNYIDTLNEIASKTKCEFLHPQPDIEVKIISENREKLNVFTFLPRKKTIKICQNKFESAKIWKKKNVPAPKSILIKSEDDIEHAASRLGLPFWLIATEGAGGRGSTPVKNVEQGKAWIRYWQSRGIRWNFMAQEYLPGKNIAFQSIWKDGEVVTSQARERIEYIYPHLSPSGITGTPSVAVTVHRDDVNKIATESVLAIDRSATGIFCVDLKENSEGVPCPVEINAGRFFTTSYFFAYAGNNMPYYYVKLAYKEKIPKLPKYNALPAGLYWIRHMDSGPILLREAEFRGNSIKKSNSNLKLVIFDLDGTILNLPIDYAALREELKSLIKPFGIKSKFKPLLTSINKSVSIIKANYGIKKATEISTALHKILKKYEVNAANKAEIIQGVKETLNKLKQLGIKLAIFSRTGRKGVLVSLKKVGLENYFDIIVAREDVKEQKPSSEGLEKILKVFNLNPEQALFVGDHVLDIVAGRKTGIKTIGLSGKTNASNLKKAGASVVVRNFSEILEKANL